MRFSTLFLIICSVFLFGCSPTKNTSKAKKNKYTVAFEANDSLSDAIDKADGDKLVFIDFYTTWCMPCKIMDQNVFVDKALGDHLNKNFISMKIDAEKGNGPNLATLYQVNVYPTLVFLDRNGKVLVKQEGAVSSSKLKALSKQALSMVK